MIGKVKPSHISLMGDIVLLHLGKELYEKNKFYSWKISSAKEVCIDLSLDSLEFTVLANGESRSVPIDKVKGIPKTIFNDKSKLNTFLENSYVTLNEFDAGDYCVYVHARLRGGLPPPIGDPSGGRPATDGEKRAAGFFLGVVLVTAGEALKNTGNPIAFGVGVACQFVGTALAGKATSGDDPGNNPPPGLGRS